MTMTALFPSSALIVVYPPSQRQVSVHLQGPLWLTVVLYVRGAWSMENAADIRAEATSPSC